MSDEQQVSELMTRLRGGDQQVADEVFHRFAGRLVGLARSRLDVDLRRKVDPEDIVQSVFMSFFRRQVAGEFELTNWDNLWSLLAMITVHKAGFRIRYYRTARRDASQEKASCQFSPECSVEWEAIAREPTPAQAVMLTETLEELMSLLDENERQVLALTLQGATPDEISLQLGCSDRTIRRVLKRIRAELEDRCRADT